MATNSFTGYQAPNHPQSNAAILQPAFAAVVPQANQTQTLSADNSGKIILIPANTAGGLFTETIFLPPIQNGLRFRLIAAGVITRAIIIASQTPNVMYGTLTNTNTGAGNVATNLVLVAGASSSFQFTGAASIGDYADLICDGTRWHVSSMSQVLAGFAL